MNFTDDLNNASSPQFKSLASTVENGLLPGLQTRIPSVLAVSVYSFKEGSVIASYYVITDPAAVITAETMQSAINHTINTDNIPSLTVDKSYAPSIACK